MIVIPHFQILVNRFPSNKDFLKHNNNTVIEIWCNYLICVQISAVILKCPL